MKVAIIGAGWVGCHLASSLIDSGLDVTIFESKLQAFAGASGNNQCRLHLGFHYPRYQKTISQILEAYPSFLNQYREFIYTIDENLYAVADSESLISFSEFMKVFDNLKVGYQKVHARDYRLTSVEGVVKTEEKFIDLRAVRNFFEAKLKNVINFNTPVSTIENFTNYVLINGDRFDWCVNATYNQFCPSKKFNCFYELCVMHEYTTDLKNVFALTVMDGPFGSIYPSSQAGDYILSSVLYTPIVRFTDINQALEQLSKIEELDLGRHKDLLEQQISQFYPNFLENFSYKKYIASIKTKPIEDFGEREFWHETEARVINAFAAKLSHVVLLEKEVRKTLKI